MQRIGFYEFKDIEQFRSIGVMDEDDEKDSWTREECIVSDLNDIFYKACGLKKNNK